MSSLWLAVQLQSGEPARVTAPSLWQHYIPLMVVCRVLASVATRLHRVSFEYPGLQDGVGVAAAAALGTGLFIPASLVLALPLPGAGVVALDALLAGTLMLAARFGPRVWHVYRNRLSRRGGRARRTLIVGAGAAGELLLRDLDRSAEHQYDVVGFLDEDASRWKSLVGGRRVLGGIDGIQDLVVRLGISTILIAIPRDSQGIVRTIVSSCAGLNVTIKALPVSFVYFRDRSAASLLHDLSPDDLLSRRRVVFAPQERESFVGRHVRVTGAAGSIGSEICRQLLALGVARLVAVDINENGLYLLEQRFSREFPGDRFAVELADIRDAGRVRALMRSHHPQDVFHAAAHKHVPLMESAPCEAVKNNVLGTRHVLEAAEAAGVECLVFISTDKAVLPSSVMGATKRVGEIMTRAVAARSGLRGCAVRFGNVLGSDGSVVPLFRQQIERGGPVTITHPDMRRYFMTIPEAVGLVLKAAYGRYGDLCVLNMGEPIRIMDLARQMIALAGLIPDDDIEIVVTGLRPGEKLNEELVTAEERVTLRADGTIRVVDGPLPPVTLWETVDELADAAASEDAGRTRELIKRLVPTYQPPDAGAVSPRPNAAVAF